MLRTIPKWVTEAEGEMHKLVVDICQKQGINYQFVDDSVAINRCISTIGARLAFIKENIKKDRFALSPGGKTAELDEEEDYEEEDEDDYGDGEEDEAEAEAEANAKNKQTPKKRGIFGKR